jgi:hypothetical protein
MLPAVIMQRFHTIFRKGVCVMLSLLKDAGGQKALRLRGMGRHTGM